MKRIFGAAVLFILLTLTIVALNKIDAPKASAGAGTTAGRSSLSVSHR